jgi:peptidoglycan/LPS O-acetylase OafA/YrhL
LSTQRLRYLGSISYGSYLKHYLAVVVAVEMLGWGWLADCPVVVEFAAASARRSIAATVKFTMLGALRIPSPNLLILRGWRAQTVKEKSQ